MVGPLKHLHQVTQDKFALYEQHLLNRLMLPMPKKTIARFRGSPWIEAAYRLGSVLHLHLFFNNERKNERKNNKSKGPKNTTNQFYTFLLPKDWNA